MKTQLSQRAQALIARIPSADQNCLRALLIFAAQNPGFEWGNYATGNYAASKAAYLSDSRPVAKQMRDIRDTAWQWSGLTDEIMRAASDRAFSGRLQFRARPEGSVFVDYCTGQYWPTEYRKAALCVLREAIALSARAFHAA